MGIPLPFLQDPPAERIAGRRGRTTRRQRIGGLVAALALEALVVLLLLTLGTRRTVEMDGGSKPLTVLDLDVPRPEVVKPAQPVKPPETRVAQPTPPTPQPPVPVPPQPVTPAPPRTVDIPPPMVKLPSEVPAPPPAPPAPVAQAAPPRPPRVYGPPAPPASSSTRDSRVVEGSGPNGEKLYAAAWQREPYESEVRGYLSTAQPPSWALIACRTVADFRVDDCVALGESPRGSQIARAVLAMAWQFRVLPPRVGGRYQVGEWVRIRFEYGLNRRQSWEQ